MLPADTFSCSFNHGIATCVARQPSAEAAYKLLALRVKAGIGQLAQVGIQIPVQEITIGLTIGAGMVLATQSIVGLISLVSPLPPALSGLFEPNAQPQQLVAIVAANADEIVSYIDNTLAVNPNAFQQAVMTAKAPPPQPIGAGSQALGALFTKDRMIALGTGVLVVGSLIALARSADRRLSGKVDRAGMFHDPNAVYDDDDGGGDDGDDADDASEEPEVIDVHATETIESEPAA